MENKAIIALIEATLEEKMNRNDDFIRYSYFELNVKYDKILPKQSKKTFIILLRNKLENMNYNVYLTGQKFEYNNAKMMVQDNEELIAIKKQGDVKQNENRRKTSKTKHKQIKYFR